MPLLLFDFDGTLADSQPLLLPILNRLAPEIGFPPLDAAMVEALRHQPSQDVWRRSPLNWWQRLCLLQRLRQELRHNIHLLQPIPGIPEALHQLHQQGIPLGILTSNTRENVTHFLQQHQLQDHFQYLQTGISLLGKARALKSFLHHHHYQPQDLIYIGDETRDIRAAQCVQIPMAAVTWGLQSSTLLASYQPQHLLTHPQDLLPLVLTIPEI